MTPDGVSGLTLPRLYQLELLEEAKRQNIIIRADTGTGKTLVAALLIKWMAAQPKPNSQRHVLQAFFAPTCSLVQQQAQEIQKRTGLRVRAFTGGKRISELALQLMDVLVCTPQVCWHRLSAALA